MRARANRAVTVEPNKGEDAQACLPKDKPPQEAEEAQDRQEAAEDHQEALLEEEAPHLRNSSSSSHHHQQRLRLALEHSKDELLTYLRVSEERWKPSCRSLTPSATPTTPMRS